MKKSGYPFLKPPAVAIAVGVILLLGVLLSFRFVAAMAAIGFIGWGIYGCTQGGKGGFFMKIVVLKSPKCLSGLLRLIFGIKKETNA